jgi:hypothetical protein
LQSIGKFALVDRSYIFRISEDAATMDNTYEWCAEGISHKFGTCRNPARKYPGGWVFEPPGSYLHPLRRRFTRGGKLKGKSWKHRISNPWSWSPDKSEFSLDSWD